MRRTAVTHAKASVEVEAGATVIDTARSPGVIAKADVVPQHVEIHAAHSTTKLTSWAKDFRDCLGGCPAFFSKCAQP